MHLLFIRNCNDCLVKFQKRDERKAEEHAKKDFIQNERKKAVERLKQYKIVRTILFSFPGCPSKVAKWSHELVDYPLLPRQHTGQTTAPLV